MYIYEAQTSDLEDWILDEIRQQGQLMVGSSGLPVRRVQEWLTLRGYALATDGSYGPVTREAVTRFQEDLFLEATGWVNEETFACLVQPMIETLRQRLTMSESVNTAVLEYARAHLEQHPREIGGENRGPWIRLYMKGNEGSQWRWCAGFVTFILHQATESLGIYMPISGSVSCDTLAAQAKAEGLFLSEADAGNYEIPPGSLFLVRRTDTDWIHAGIVEEASEQYLRTIEGNTNDAGEPEGYEVCARWRGYGDKDFVLMP
jgi:peptidoglycan hydrolase-like protein with peptidoglycan-binding domain